MATATRTASIDNLRTKAATEWRSWAHSLATTGKLPPTRDLLDCCSLLGRAVDALERDAEIVRKHERHRQEADHWRVEAERVEEERGPTDDIEAKIIALEAEIEVLRDRLRDGYYERMQQTTARIAAEKIARPRPDLFGETS